LHRSAAEHGFGRWSVRDRPIVCEPAQERAAIDQSAQERAAINESPQERATIHQSPQKRTSVDQPGWGRVSLSAQREDRTIVDRRCGERAMRLSRTDETKRCEPQ
jgi:hypothetical protein